MGQAKRQQMEDWENEAFNDWLEDKYGLDFIEEDTPEWGEAKDEFNSYCMELERLAIEEHEEEQYSYYLHLTLKDADAILDREISNLRLLLKSPPGGAENSMLYKMCYAYSITILEAYLEDIVKALILSNTEYLSNTVEKVKPFSNTAFVLSELNLFREDGISKFVLSKLSGISYHNIPKVIKVLSGVIGHDVQIKMGDVVRIVIVRHDIVHRNGKNKDGDLIEIKAEDAEEAIDHVEYFFGLLRAELEKIIGAGRNKHKSV